MKSAETLRALRERKGLTQYRLAKQVPCDTKTIHFIESGTSRNPRGSTLLGIAKALRVSMERVYAAIQNTPEAA